MRRFVFVYLFVALTKSMYSPDDRFLDSVKNALTTARTTKEKLITLYTLSFEYGLKEPRIGLRYAQLCFDLAQKVNDKDYQLNAYNGMGNSYETLANFDSAKYYHTKSYEIAKQLGTTNRIATTLFNIALCDRVQGNYKSALNMYLEAYKLLEKESKYNYRIHFYLGEMYLKLNAIKDAETHSRIGISKTENTEVDYVSYYMKINLAKCFLKTNKRDSALYLLNTTLPKLERNSDLSGLSLCYITLGELYYNLKDYTKAMHYFQEDFIVQNKMNNQSGICISFLNMADASVFLNQKAKAITFLNESIKRLSFIEKNDETLENVYYKISRIYELAGNPELALHYFKLYNLKSQSLLNKDNLRQLNELQTRYQTHNKEQQIMVQKAKLAAQVIIIEEKKLQLIMIISAALTIIIIILFIYYRKRAQQKLQLLIEAQRQEKLKEKALLEKENEERTRISKDIHDELGSGISKISLIAEYSKQNQNDNKFLIDNMHSISKTAQSLSENMRDLVWALNNNENSLDNLAARMYEYIGEYFEELPIKYQVQFPETIPSIRINNEIARNIFLSFKEAINNSAKHSGAEKLIIYLAINGDDLIIKITDDGKGFDLNNAKKSGNGLNNMKNRINSCGGAFNINSSDKGTEIEFRFNLNKLNEIHLRN